MPTDQPIPEALTKIQALQATLAEAETALNQAQFALIDLKDDVRKLLEKMENEQREHREQMKRLAE